ncbi:MAG: hypothetical protein KF856_15695 [Cyclobacteriaceae bacterium]|nr:hypothetical protein [Cyclobacteriaceae bacterium]
MRYSSIFLMLVLLACEDKPVVVDLGTDFFPLRTGREWTYTIRQTAFSYLADPVETSYQMRVAVTDSVLINTSTTYFMEVSTRSNPTEMWQPAATWSASLTGNQLIQNESNVTRVKMVFPIGPTTVWDSNTFNNEAPFLRDYVTTAQQRLSTIENFNQPRSLSTELNFEHTLTVVIRNLFDPIIGEDIQKETYARGTGLIAKEVSQAIFCTQGSCTGKKQGVSYTQTLISYVP